MKLLALIVAILFLAWVSLKLIGIVLSLLPLLLFFGGLTAIVYVSYSVYTYAKKEGLLDG